MLAAYVWVAERAAAGQLGSVDLSGLLRENRWLEWIQIGLLGVLAVGCLGAFRAGQPVLHRALCLMLMAAVFRELDSFLEGNLFENAHTVGMGLILTALVALCIVGRDSLKREIPSFLNRPSFYLMLFGAMLVVVYAQILGQREIWRTFSPDLLSESKRYIEEGLEFMGYLVIGCGVFEERFFGALPNPEDPS